MSGGQRFASGRRIISWYTLTQSTFGSSSVYPIMSDIDYATVTQALQRIAVPTDAAEIHGAICAILSTQGAAGKVHWLASVLPEVARAINEGDALAAEVRRMLDDVFDQVSAELATGEFALTLLLPDDDDDLGERATALGRWCQGFLLGLQIGGVSSASGLTAELAEIYQDFAEISQISGTELTAEDDDEESYAELYEYLKVGAILFYEEFNQPSPGADSSPNLH